MVEEHRVRDGVDRSRAAIVRGLLSVVTQEKGRGGGSGGDGKGEALEDRDFGQALGREGSREED